MSVELLYTSAPKGLRTGSRGFCTVLSTAGTPINLAQKLESLSGYRHLFATDSPEAGKNPVAYSHLKFQLAGQPTSVISRVAAYGADYSGRTNKLAHHVVVEPHEAPAAGPAWLLQQPSVVRVAWDGECQTPAAGPTLPQGNQIGGFCARWQEITGDAGWGGVVAEAFLKRGGKPTWIVCSIDQQEVLLELLNESIALLPPNQRWEATFTTYASQLPPDIDCRVRCVFEGTEEAKFAAARGQVVLVNNRDVPQSDSVLIQRARGIASPGQPYNIDKKSSQIEAGKSPVSKPSRVVSPPQSTLPNVPTLPCHEASTEAQGPPSLPDVGAPFEAIPRPKDRKALRVYTVLAMATAACALSLLVWYVLSRTGSRDQAPLVAARDSTDARTHSEITGASSSAQSPAKVTLERVAKEGASGQSNTQKDTDGSASKPSAEDGTTATRVASASQADDSSSAAGADPAGKALKKGEIVPEVNQSHSQPPMKGETTDDGVTAVVDLTPKEPSTTRSSLVPVGPQVGGIAEDVREILITEIGTINYDRLFKGEAQTVVSVDLSDQPYTAFDRYDWVLRDEEKQVVAPKAAESAQAIWIPDRKKIDDSDLLILQKYGDHSSKTVDAAFVVSSRTLWLRTIDTSDSPLAKTAGNIEECVKDLVKRYKPRSEIVTTSQRILAGKWVEGSESIKESFQKASDYLNVIQNFNMEWPSLLVKFESSYDVSPRLQTEDLKERLKQFEIIPKKHRDFLINNSINLNQMIDSDWNALTQMAGEIHRATEACDVDMKIDMLVEVDDADDQTRQLRIPISFKARLDKKF